MIDQLCGIDHDGYGPCTQHVNHLQACPACGRDTYLVIHSCPAEADDDRRAAEMYE